MSAANTRQQRPKKPNIFLRIWRSIFYKKNAARKKKQRQQMPPTLDEVIQVDVLAASQITAISTEAKPTEAKPTETKLAENKPIVAALASQIENKKNEKPKVKEDASSGTGDGLLVTNFGAASLQIFLNSLPRMKMLTDNFPENLEGFYSFEIYEADQLPKSSKFFAGDFAVQIRNFFSFYHAHLVRKALNSDLYNGSTMTIDTINQQLSKLAAGKQKIAFLLSLKEYVTWLQQQQHSLDLDNVGYTFSILNTMNASDILTKPGYKPLEIKQIITGRELQKLQKEYKELHALLDSLLVKTMKAKAVAGKNKRD